MPSHSSSSHSSHSSSSHSSSFRSSSSSRSYSSSSRSYSSRPSSHSSSSHSSTYTGSGKSYSRPSGPAPSAFAPYLPKGQTPYKPPRARYNQPVGWIPEVHRAPRRTYYGLNHTYVYYPESWTANNGTSYNAGYYDENGEYYSDVSFKKDDSYENLTCRCDYCGTDTVINCKSADTTTLTCAACGAPLTVKTQMDEMTAAPEDEYGNPVSVGAAPARKKKRSGLWTILIILAAVLLLRTCMASMFRSEEPEPFFGSSGGLSSIGSSVSTTNTDRFGTTLHLRRVGDNAYTLVSDGSEDKTMEWVESEESYYDEDSNCYLWYNTNVTPNLWQYWYDSISSNYESGWMEYENGTWYIETDWGNWIQLPSEYSTDGLWHLE